MGKHKIILILLFIIVVLLLNKNRILFFAGEQLILDTTPEKADASVVLCTGVDYYPRLLHAASLYKNKIVRKIIINGNRKSDVFKVIENKGYTSCCQWYENSIRILVLYGVSRKDVITISAENAFDTISEAQIVGEAIQRTELKSLIVTTSKFHTRRAGYIWRKMYSSTFQIFTSAATEDPFNPKGWWRSGRQIRWLLSEYGAWGYFWWKKIGKIV